MIAAAFASAGCSNPLEFFTGDPEPPQDNGVAWRCVGKVQLYGTSGFPKKDINVAICANPTGVPQSELVRECEEECGQLYRGFGVTIGGSCDPNFGNCTVDSDSSEVAFTFADCSVDRAEALGTNCLDTEGWLLPNDVGQFGAALTVGESNFQVEVDLPSPIPGDVSGGANVAGRVSFTIVPDPRIGTCPPAGCRILITQLDLTTSPNSFDVDNAIVGVTLSDVRVTNRNVWEGSWQPNGSFVILADQASVQTNFSVDGDHGSLSTTANNDLTGTAKPTTGEFSISGISFSRDDATITGAIRAVVDRFPPTARIEPRQGTVECNGVGAATIDYSAVSSTDPEGDIIGFGWEHQRAGQAPANLGPGVDKQVELPLGTNRLIVTAFDARAAWHSDFVDVSAVDTTAPTLVPAPVSTVVGCAAGGLATFPAPSVSDICTETASIVVRGDIIASSVPGLAVPIALANGTAVVPPGNYTVRWTATDGSNNSAFVDQSFTLESCWPMYGRVKEHGARSPFAGPQTNERLFVFDLPDGDVWSSPAVATDGTIYFGSDDNKVYAVNSDGTLKWQRATGGDVKSSPAIGLGGVVYVGSDDDRLYALDPSTGAVKCSRDLGDRNVRSSPAIGSDGTVYVGSDDDRLYALDPNTCALKWSVKTGADVASSPAVGPNGDVYVGSDDNKVYARHPDGSAKWTRQTNGDVKSSPALASDGATLYVGSDDERLYALNAATGAVVWATDLDFDVKTRPAIGADGTVYVMADLGRFFALRPTNGTVLWSRQLAQDLIANSSPIVGVDGTVYVGSDETVYAMNGQTGATVWSFDADRDFRSSPAIGLDGTLYIGSDDDKLFAFNVSGSPLQTLALRGPISDGSESALLEPESVRSSCSTAAAGRGGRSRTWAWLVALAGVLAFMSRRRRGR